MIRSNVEALMIRIGFWGILYYICDKETTENPILIIKAPTL